MERASELNPNHDDTKAQMQNLRAALKGQAVLNAGRHLTGRRADTLACIGPVSINRTEKEHQAMATVIAAIHQNIGLK